MIDKNFIEKIEEMTVKEFEFEGIKFTNKPLFQVRSDDEPMPNPLSLQTLTGLVDYIKKHPDNSKNYLIHVKDHAHVILYGELEKRFGRRKKYIEVSYNDFEFNFNSFLEREYINIKLQTQFFDTENQKKLLNYIGNIRDETIKIESDDGIAQQTTIKDGIAIVDIATIPSPIELAPRRTFNEIDLIESQYVIRMSRGYKGIEVGIFESDGGRWKSKANELPRSRAAGYRDSISTLAIVLTCAMPYTHFPFPVL